jgi:hypothetical protein
MVSYQHSGGLPRHGILRRAAFALGVAAAFAVAPITAQAATTQATGTRTGGSVSNTAPAITAFTAGLTGRNQTVRTTVGAWSVTDARDNNAGYSVTVTASLPTIDGSSAAAGTGGSLTLTPTTATAASGNPPSTAPVPAPAQILSTIAATIENAPAGAGQGQWNFAADIGAVESLAALIPGDASAGTYSSTLTFTTAAPAA